MFTIDNYAAYIHTPHTMNIRVVILVCLLLCVTFTWVNSQYFSGQVVEHLPKAQLQRFTLLKDVAISPALYTQYSRASVTLKPVQANVRPRGFPDIDTKGLWRDASGQWNLVKAPYPIDFRALVPEPGAVFLFRNTGSNASKPSMNAMKQLSVGTTGELLQYVDVIDYFL